VDVASSGAANTAGRGWAATHSEVADDVAQRRGRSGCDVGGRQRLAVLPTTAVDDVTAGGERRRARCSTDGATRTGVQWCAATPCAGVAGTAPAGSAGDVWRCHRARVRRRRGGAATAAARRRAATRNDVADDVEVEVEVEVGAVPAGSAGDVLPSRRVRVRRRERATISDRRGGLAAVLLSRRR